MSGEHGPQNALKGGDAGFVLSFCEAGDLQECCVQLHVYTYARNAIKVFNCMAD